MKHSQKINLLKYAQLNLAIEYNSLINKEDNYKNIAERNTILEEALLVSKNAIEEVVKALEKENAWGGKYEKQI